MIIVTGGAGFIGSNLVKGLNEADAQDILIVDNLSRGEKFKNLTALRFTDFRDKHTFLLDTRNGRYNGEKIDAVFHQGACADTMEYNGKYMLENNYEYSKTLFHFCLEQAIPFIYASSAAVYGSGGKAFREHEDCEEALNVYAFSKLLFDRYVRRFLPSAKSQVVGMRYFNVFGPQENHKGRMASMVYQIYQQVVKSGVVRLFEGTDGYGDGEQLRDFVYVKDVVKANLFFFANRDKTGLFNCGTAKARTFNAVAEAVIKTIGRGQIEYIPFPQGLRGKYQSFTQADGAELLKAGYPGGFSTLEDAVADYCRYLSQNGGYLT